MDGQKKTEEAVPAPAAPGATTTATATDPTLTAKLLANYQALQNDLQQARELATDFQCQLAGKSNEFADLKRVFSETKSHLTRLEANIAELREERHRLAGEAMRAVAFERKLVERDENVTRLEASVIKLREERHRLASEALRGTALDRKLAERDAQIAQLQGEIATLQERLARATAPGSAAGMRSRGPKEASSGWRSWFRRET